MIPEGWQQSRLGDLADIRFSNVDKKSHEYEQPVKLCNYTDVYYNSRITSHIPFMHATAKEREVERFSLQQGDVIITKDSETPEDIAVPSFVSEPLENVLCGYHLTLLRPHEGIASGEYLSHLFGLPSVQHHFYVLANGITRFGLTSDAVTEAPIVLPPLPEQKKIAAILTSVDEAIEKQEAQIAKLQNLKKAMIQELLTQGIGHTEFKDSPVGRIPKAWDCRELGSVLKKIEGGGTPSRTVESYWQGNIPWATVKDLTAVYLVATEESIGMDGLEKSSSKLIPARTIIIATRMAVGKAVIFDRAVAINQDLKALFPNENVDASFLLQWYLSRSEYIESLGTGSTVKGIRLEELRALSVGVPPLPEQKKIAAILTSVDDCIEAKQKKLAQTRALKKALMQDLLTGKIRVKV